MQFSARTVQCSLHNVQLKVHNLWSIMASAAKRSRSSYTAEQILELLEEEENSNDGISSDEESVLDHLLLDSEEDWRYEPCKLYCLVVA